LRQLPYLLCFKLDGDGLPKKKEYVVCAGQLFCLGLNQTNSSAIFKRQPFYLELDPKEAVQTRKKRREASGRGKRKE